jgi:hypothetical protein
MDERREGEGDEPRFDEIFAKVRARKVPGKGTPPKKLRTTIPLLVIFALIAVGGWFLVRKLQEVSRIQDCVMSGRKNCDHIEDSQER